MRQVFTAGECMIGALFSGGKDSTLAIHMASNSGMRPELLITMRSRNEDSYMFHRPNVEFCSLQASALGMRSIEIDTEGNKEAELDDLARGLRDSGVSVLITGAVASRYQKDRVDRICIELGIRHVSPLWGIDPLAELNILARDFDVIITRVAAEGFDESMLGKRIDSSMIDRLVSLNRRYGINMVFEGGEAETFVLNAPMFSKRVIIDRHRIERDGSRASFIIEDAHLSE